jgi:hypothetical protein
MRVSWTTRENNKLCRIQPLRMVVLRVQLLHRKATGPTCRRHRYCVRLRRTRSHRFCVRFHRSRPSSCTHPHERHRNCRESPCRCSTACNLQGEKNKRVFVCLRFFFFGKIESECNAARTNSHVDFEVVERHCVVGDFRVHRDGEIDVLVGRHVDIDCQLRISVTRANRSQQLFPVRQI